MIFYEHFQLFGFFGYTVASYTAQYREHCVIFKRERDLFDAIIAAAFISTVNAVDQRYFKRSLHG